MSDCVDPKEIQKFSDMAKTWWDPQGPFRPLHRFNPIRIEYITQQLQKQNPTLSGLQMLDIGCGGGLLSEPMARLGAKVTAIDASEKNIEIAKLHAKESGLTIRYHHQTVDQLLVKKTRFDVILNMEVIEHVQDPALFLKHSAALLKPGGIMFVATLNRTIKSYLFAIIGAEYILRWLPRGTHEWHKFIKPSEMEAMLSDTGCHRQALTGVTFNPLTQSWSLSDDLSINYMMCIVADST